MAQTIEQQVLKVMRKELPYTYKRGLGKKEFDYLVKRAVALAISKTRKHDLIEIEKAINKDLENLKCLDENALFKQGYQAALLCLKKRLQEGFQRARIILKKRKEVNYVGGNRNNSAHRPSSKNVG